MKKIALASLLALPLSAPALAADFSGPSVEAHIGWDHPEIKASYLGDSAKGHKDGFAYGGGLGWDYRMGNLVLGVSAAIDGSTVKDCIAEGTASFCLKAGRDIEAGGRIGQVVGGKALIYAKLAYANSQVRGVYRDSATPSDNFSEHSNRDGVRFGGGVEFQLTPRTYVKAEYRYTTYKAYHADIAGNDLRLKLDRHQVVGGIGYRF